MVALQRAKKPVVDTGVTNWVTTDLVTQIVPRGSTLTSALCRLRQLVEVQGHESHAEAAKEDDQALTGDGHKGAEANEITKCNECLQYGCTGYVEKSPAGLASLGRSVIASAITSAVFIGDSNAGGCPRSKSAEATSIEAHQKADEKTDVET